MLRNIKPPCAAWAWPAALNSTSINHKTLPVVDLIFTCSNLTTIELDSHDYYNCQTPNAVFLQN